MANEYQLQLRPAAFLTVTTPDGSATCRLDVYETWRFLTDAQKTADENKRWQTVKTWLAEKLGVSPADLAESNARMLNETIVAIGNAEQEALKKTAQQTVSSVTSTPELKEDIQPGILT